MSTGVDADLVTVLQTQFLLKTVDVGSHRAFADNQACGNLAVLQPFAQQSKNLGFSLAELGRPDVLAQPVCQHGGDPR